MIFRGTQAFPWHPYLGASNFFRRSDVNTSQDAQGYKHIHSDGKLTRADRGNILGRKIWVDFIEYEEAGGRQTL